MEKTIDYELVRGDIPRLIKDMNVGDVLRFPLAKLDSVRSVVYNRLLVEKSDGARWTVTVDLPGKAAIVTRTS